MGSYGHISIDTGALDIEGNIYDPEFQKYVDDCDGIKLADYPPEYSQTEIKTLMTSIWTRRKEFQAPADACVSPLLCVGVIAHCAPTVPRASTQPRSRASSIS